MNHRKQFFCCEKLSPTLSLFSNLFTGLWLALILANLPLFDQSAYADENTSEAVYIESLSNATNGVTIEGQQTNGPAQLGMTLEPGDKIQTHDSSIRIVYPDGSALTLGRNSEFEIKKSEEAANSKHVELSYLHSGFVHARVKHQESSDEPHFIIESKTAVTGVRGTEFTMSQETSGEVQIHTLEGRVAVATERAKLKGAQVFNPEEFASVKAGVVSPPQKFNMIEFRKKLNSEYPEIHKIIYNKIRTPNEVKSQAKSHNQHHRSGGRRHR